MNRIIRTSLLPLLILLGLGCNQGGKSVRIQYKFETGQHLVYEQVTKGTSKAMAKGARGDSLISDRVNEITATVETEVRRIVDDSVGEVTEKSQFRFKSFNRIDSSRIDSTEPGRELIMYIAPNGKVLDLQFVTGTEDMNVSYLKNFYEQGMPVFPSEEIGLGYAWTQSTKVILDEGPIDASTTFKIESFVREQGYDCAVVSYDGNMVLPLDAAPADSLKRRGVDRVHMQGKLYFAYKQGIVVLQRETWDLHGKRQRTMNGKNQDYTVAVNYEVSYALRDVKSPGK